MQVIRLLPDRLYPGMQPTSTLVPWFRGNGTLVIRSKISGSPVHLSEEIRISLGQMTSKVDSSIPSRRFFDCRHHNFYVSYCAAIHYVVYIARSVQFEY